MEILVFLEGFSPIQLLGIVLMCEILLLLKSNWQAIWGVLLVYAGCGSC